MKSPVLTAAVLVGGVAFALTGVRESLMKDRSDPAAFEMAASATPAPANGMARITRQRDGHYWTTAIINNVPVRFLVDTGASAVVLTGADAQKLGINPAHLTRRTEVQTAAGRVQAGTTYLQLISIEGVRVAGVEAMVIEQGLEHSLLGMSFLSKLSRWEVTQDAIVLRQ